MSRLPDAVVGDAYTSDHVWRVLTELVETEPRMAGWEGEAEGATVVADAFDEVGVREVNVNEFDIDGWWRGASSVSVRETDREYVADHEVVGLPGTPAGAVTGRLVDVGGGGPRDFEVADLNEAVAMASSRKPDGTDRRLHRMEKYVMAVEAGAEAFIFRNHVEGCLPPTGEIGYHERPGPIPAVGVSAELGARLARYAGEAAGGVGAEVDTPTVTVDVDAESGPGTSRNVEGVVGPDTEREVLVTAHVDAHDIAEGAADNGTGCAIVAEVGRLLAAAADELETRVRLITFGAEEVGLWGAYHWAETHDLSKVKCVINVDGAGMSRDPRVGTNGFDSVEAVFEEVCADLDAPLETSDDVMPHGDQWAFVQEGVPAAFASSQSESSGRGYGHTHADTLDKLDRRDLRALAVAFAEATVAAADREFTHRTREETRERIDESYERELRRGGRWPYDG
jgi:Zn-dependent M28 family amino/carboxypeptidase